MAQLELELILYDVADQNINHLGTEVTPSQIEILINIYIIYL